MIARTTNLICIKIGIVYSKTFPFMSILIMLGVEGVYSDQMDEPTIIKWFNSLTFIDLNKSYWVAVQAATLIHLHADIYVSAILVIKLGEESQLI